MKIYKEVKTTVNKVIAINCNKCGKELIDEEFDYEMFHEIEIIFGYGDDLDGSKWEFDLCSDCIIDFVKQFKIPVKETKYL